MSKRCICFAITLMVIFVVGCATRGPVVPVAPSVQVTQFDSVLFTPDVIKFQAKLLINNRMDAELNIQKIDYGADVNDKQMFTDSFTQLKPLSGNGQLTVTFPFQIAMKDIKDQAVDVLAEEAIHVSFRGQVYPAGDFGFGPIPIKTTRTIPLPKVPGITIEQTEGSPLKRFTVFLKIQNTNSFPLNLQPIYSYIELNRIKYGMLRTQGSTEIKPGASKTIALEMEESAGKTLIMEQNIATSSSIQFTIGGDIKFDTPYGLIFIPLKLSSETK